MSQVIAPRVLQVALSLNPGGTERLLLEIISRLHADIPMMLCCLDEPGAWAPELEARGVEVRASGRRPGFQPALGRWIARAARRHGATVIHAHHYSPFVYSCLGRLSAPSVPILYTEHGRVSDAPPSAKRRRVNRFLRHAAKQVYAVSEDLKRFMVDEGFSADGIRVIYNGIAVGCRNNARVRADVRRRLGIPDATIVVGTIARLDPVKDLATLLGAVAATRMNGSLVLLVIGDGPERASLERRAQELGLGAAVRFTGHQDNAREWLAACDVYVNSSISEGISLTILEAMAASLPVVATRVGGTPEILDETCARLVPARDVNALGAALLGLARSSDTRTALGEAGRRRVEQRFTIERMVDQYRGAYTEAR
jgi:glycosyltransferase involved in cell wall biosynthesis